jgi:hypothetical protein
VLVIGRRQGLERALDRAALPYVLWLTSPPSAVPTAPVHIGPFVSTKAAVERAAEALDGPFTHVIAAVEAAVPTASYARRIFGARSSPHTVAMRCSDKLFMKQQLQAAGVPVTEFADLNTIAGQVSAEELGHPLVVKDRRSSGSRGVEVVDSFAAVPPTDRRNRLAERMINGVEMSVESFVVDGEPVFISTTAYAVPRHVNIVPAQLDPATRAAVEAINRAALAALRIRWGMTHLELFLTDQGPVVGEVALRPPGGYIMNAIERAWGFDPWEALVDVELDRPVTLPSTPLASAAVSIFHPGEGRLVAIEGAKAVRKHPACEKLKLKLKPGDEVRPREGVGVDIGYALLMAPTDEEVREAVSFVDEHLRFVVEPL